MKVLIMNDNLIFGGTEVQSIREKKILEQHGNEVKLLTFDAKFPKGHEIYNEMNGFINIPINKSMLKMGLDGYIINKNIYNKINNVIEQFNPDIIHANNLYTSTLAQYKAMSKKKNLQTIRDYASVCPLATCVKPNGSVCKGSKYNNCYLECGKSIKNFCKIAVNSRNNQLRKKYVDKFACPSQKLTDYSNEHGYKVSCINNSFDFQKILDFHKNINFERKKYLYYGAISDDKGVIPLMRAFNEFSKGKNTELIIAGKVKNDAKKEFDKLLEISSNISYLGFLNYDQMLETLKDIYTIVVPSKWMENYPNTVLEGQATRTLVIGSDRGGIPDMLSNGMGFVFDVMNQESIITCLEKSYNLTEKEYYKIVLKCEEYVKSNNSFEKYYLNIMSKLKE